MRDGRKIDEWIAFVMVVPKLGQKLIVNTKTCRK